MVAAGHWRAETEQEKKSTWEESVRLRERMFWSRLGGGVVPAFLPARESPRSAVFATADRVAPRKSEESHISEGKPLDSAVDVHASPGAPRKSEDDPFQSKEGDRVKRVSIGKTVIADEPQSAQTLTKAEETSIEKQAEAQLQNEVRKSLENKNLNNSALQRQRSVSSPISPLAAPRKKEERLSLTIPGSFE
jgi:hypothetical protein